MDIVNNSIIANQHVERRRPSGSTSDMGAVHHSSFYGRGSAGPSISPLLHQETVSRHKESSPRHEPASLHLENSIDRAGELGKSLGRSLSSGFHFIEDHLLPPRLRGKSSMRALAAAGLGLMAVLLAFGLYWYFSTRPYPLPNGRLALPNDHQIDAAILSYLSPELSGANTDDDTPEALPPLPKTLSMSSYRVRKGDSLNSIAKRFGLNVDTIVSVNGIKSARSLSSGRSLKIPNMDGVVHTVTRGESLGLLASKYKVSMTQIADCNDLGSAVITPGQSIFIPGARLSTAMLRQIYGTTVIWPARGPISSYFGYRADPFTGVRSYHSGIDIVVNMGTPVKAAMDGVVAAVGYNASYGNYVILNHGGGLQTLYGHLSRAAVAQGQSVRQGTVIAYSGNTGYSTGPHLHFGVYKNGVLSNPLKLLK